MSIAKSEKERLRAAERENMRLQAENAQLSEIIQEQADALIELAEIIEGGQE